MKVFNRLAQVFYFMAFVLLIASLVVVEPQPYVPVILGFLCAGLFATAAAEYKGLAR